MTGTIFRRFSSLYLLDDTTYLHIQASGGEWDYTLYDKASQRDLDGGVMDGADIDIARQRILRFHSLNPAKVEDAPLEMVDILRDAAAQAMQTAAEAIREQHEARMDELREHFAQEDAALWDTKLDEYPGAHGRCGVRRPGVVPGL